MKESKSYRGRAKSTNAAYMRGCKRERSNQTTTSVTSVTSATHAAPVTIMICADCAMGCIVSWTPLPSQKSNAWQFPERLRLLKGGNIFFHQTYVR